MQDEEGEFFQSRGAAVTNAEWIKLFRQLPQDLHSKLILVLHNRTEIVIDAIYRLEPAFAVIRGRLGGTIEGGLLVMTPYNQITSMYITREIPEENVRAIFENMQPGTVAEAGANSKLSDSDHAAPAPEPANPQAPAPDPSAMRSNLLERLRAARAAGAPGIPK